MDFKEMTIYPEYITDAIIYVLVLMLLCALSKIVYDLKENRRLKKVWADYVQRRTDEDE